MNIEVVSENALMVYLGREPSPSVSSRIQALVVSLEALMGSDLIDTVPSYASLLIIFNPFSTNHRQVQAWLGQALAALDTNTPANTSDVNPSSTSKLVKLPVYYSETSGPDLAALADRAKLSVSEVIDLHQSIEYQVYAIGFAPGFAYLGEVDSRIAAPRLASPRQRVPKGAVAIADRQTAVYPATSPGGWNLIGLCPTAMFTPSIQPPMPIRVGDRVRFTAIDQDEFLALGGQLNEAALLAGSSA